MSCVRQRRCQEERNSACTVGSLEIVSGLNAKSREMDLKRSHDRLA